jgi:exodeoxyribonuclease VIII
MKALAYENEIKVGNYYEGIPNDTYHAHKSISKSGLDLIERDPFHYFNQKPMEQTRPMQVGSAIHAAILEPEVFKTDYMMLPEIKDRRQPEYKEAVKRYGVSKVFTSNDCENISNMQKAVLGNSEAKHLLEQDGYFELSGFVNDPVTGLICRHRFDKLAVVDGYAVDVKKTQDVRPFKFSRSIGDYRYHVQDAFYLDQYEWLTGEKLKGMKFIAVEEKFPHKVAVYQLDDISRQIGREAYRKNLNTYAEFINNGTKPHNNDTCQIISVTEWMMREYEDQLV